MSHHIRKKRNRKIILQFQTGTFQLKLFQFFISYFQMAGRNTDEIINRFIGVTQCSKQEAAEFLAAAEWNEEKAVDFFFDSSASQPRDPVPTQKPRQSVIKPAPNFPGVYETIHTKYRCFFFLINRN
jgi:hypothetical protein